MAEQEDKPQESTQPVAAKRRGLTLIELVLSMVLIAVVAVVIFLVAKSLQ